MISFFFQIGQFKYSKYTLHVVSSIETESAHARMIFSEGQSPPSNKTD